ncbi:MFS transporter [Oceanicoccus sp. KOV_DT_Chl]|uniref:MFS transporter n=1 Tax=Oceanicoccus sp. KOV_DT_Chl TaxID=1904639 RepID=UPI000C7B392B|nr:MFS transporter [Oceanicoccus sp. KOV_DT_Chl]
MSNTNQFGPVTLAPGYTRTNAFGFLLAAFTAIPLVSFINFAQPFLLEEVFHVPKEEQGVLTGQLAAMQEFIVLLLMGVVGASSDNFGRRIIMVVGLAILALGLVIYPLATAASDLYAYRIIFAIGASMVPVMYSVTLHDTSANKSRGVFTAMGSFCTGLGMVLISMQIGKLPQRLIAQGVDPIMAGRYAYWAMAALAVVVALLIHCMWKSGRATTATEKTPVLKLMREGFGEAATNPRIALSYFTAFASRGDLVVIGTFMSLWVVQSSSDFALTSAEGLARAGIMVAIVQGVAMIWAIAMGILSDRINRVASVCIGFTIAAFAYMNISFIDNPFSSSALFACALLGIGEISTIVSGSALIGEEAPAERRGSVLGVFNVIGATGILLGTYFGGVVFDGIGKTAPFMLMGIINGLVAVTALSILVFAPSHQNAKNNAD